MSEQQILTISASQTEVNPEVLLLRLDGVLDTLTSPQLESVINRLLGQERFKLVVDLAGVDYISSAGWGIFIAHLKDLRDRNGDLKLARMLPEVKEVFELLEFDTVIKSYDNLEAATTDFAAKSPSPVSFHSDSGIGEFQSRIDIPPGPGRALSEINETNEHKAKTSVAEKVLVIVQGDPLLRIPEIKRELKSARFGRVQASWLKVFFILLSNKLLRLRSRCLYARQRGKVFAPHSDTI
ncbi:MAG: STAS domain-containing protein [candidate division Zixibacteria bacterium]|nr:STAS domain-containing protein [candidate division Zixibacteria bacterium]